MNKSNFFSQTAPSINIAALVACIVGLISTFLAKVVEKATYLGQSVKDTTSIVSAYGIFIIALFVVTIVILIVKKNNSALIVAVVNAIFCIFKLIQQLAYTSIGLSAEEKEIMDMITAAGGTYTMSVNFFFWLMVIGAVAAAVILLIPAFGAKKNNQTQMPQM